MKNSLENSLPHILVASEKETVNGFPTPNKAVSFPPPGVIGWTRVSSFTLRHGMDDNLFGLYVLSEPNQHHLAF